MNLDTEIKHTPYEYTQLFGVGKSSVVSSDVPASKRPKLNFGVDSILSNKNVKLSENNIQESSPKQSVRRPGSPQQPNIKITPNISSLLSAVSELPRKVLKIGLNQPKFYCTSVQKVNKCEPVNFSTMSLRIQV